MKRTYEIEDAFQKIRASTGLTDVQEIVHKFLTREQTYSQLLMAVSDNERKIDNLRRENEHWREKLHELQMQQADENANNQGKKSSALSPELQALDTKIVNLRKQCEKAEELNKKVQLVNDQVVGWSTRIAQKIDQQFQENICNQYPPDAGKAEQAKLLAGIFERIAGAVIKQVQLNVIEADGFDNAGEANGEGGEEKPVINLTAFLNDFGNQDFLDKNVRVRPVSGQTRAGGDNLDETKTNLDGGNGKDGKSMMMGGGDANDDEEKFNRMINLDMEEQRKNIKIKRDEYLRRKQIEEEKKQKKKPGQQ